MKKFLALAMAFVLLCSLAACGKNKTPNPSTNEPQFKAGILFVGDPETPFTFEASHYNGITAAMGSCGMDVSSQLLIEKNIGRDMDSITAAIQRLVKQGANVIFGTDGTFYSAMSDASESHSTVLFACYGDQESYTNNFITYFSRMYQACYLSGIVAGAKSLETGNNVIGYVSTYGIEYSETASAINAFTLGAQAVNPDAQVYVSCLDVWSDEANETSLARDFVNSFKCGIITQNCNSPLPMKAAEDLKAFGCGYGSDMTDAAPNAHLVSTVWNWELFYKKALEAATACEKAETFADLMGGVTYYAGLKEGLVDITPLTEASPAGAKDATQKVKELITSGQWDVFSGVKLKITLDNGSATIQQYDDALVDQNEDVHVEAGGPSLDDQQICSMGYFLISVLDA